jgi:hypothetical protein
MKDPRWLRGALRNLSAAGALNYKLFQHTDVCAVVVDILTKCICRAAVHHRASVSSTAAIFLLWGLCCLLLLCSRRHRHKALTQAQAQAQAQTQAQTQTQSKQLRWIPGRPEIATSSGRPIWAVADLA